jgi:hypothetical protein
MRYLQDDVRTWGGFCPLIIAHDVGRSRYRSTAVVGGNAPIGRRLLGVSSAEELPQGLCGTARASALAAIDRRYHNNGLIVADLSNDATYGEVLVQTFGSRVIGLHISRHGDGMNREVRSTPCGPLLVYTIGRSYLLELFERELRAEFVRFIKNPGTIAAYQQLERLSVEYRAGGTVYSCVSGGHDDLGISLAMLAWAAQHPHLPFWHRNTEAARRPRRPRPKVSWAAWT